MYGNKDGSIPASYRILYFIGWKPDPSQVNIYEDFIYYLYENKIFIFLERSS